MKIGLLSPKSGVKLLNASIALKSRHSLLQHRMHRGSLLLTCMPYVTSPKAYKTLLHACALSFPECSYVCILFPGTNYHICIVITLAAWVSVGLPWGPRWSLVVPDGCRRSTSWCPSHEFWVFPPVYELGHELGHCLWISRGLGVCWFICIFLGCACYMSFGAFLPETSDSP